MTRYRFLLRPRWLLFHLVVVTAVVAMVNLGFWQLRRLDERQAFNATVEARIDQPPVPLGDLLPTGATTDGDLSALEWRPVTTAGAYVPGETITVVNKSQGGIAGSFVVTPLRLDDERILLVERGFVPLSEASTPPAPTGTVEVTGRLRPSQERQRGGLSDPADGDLAEVQRIDIGRLAIQIPGDVLPMYVELTSSRPAEAGPLPLPIARPELANGPHLSYAGQWFIFAIAVVVGWVLAVRHSVASRRNPHPPPEARAAPDG